MQKEERNCIPLFSPLPQLCFTCVGKSWRIGQTPPVHCCSWTQDISVLLLMQAQRCAFIINRKHPTTGERTEAVILRNRVRISPTCHFMHVNYAFRHWPSEDSSDISIVAFKCLKYPLKSDPFAYDFHVVHFVYSFCNSPFHATFLELCIGGPP